MILISGSSEREIVDLQQGDYEGGPAGYRPSARQGCLPRAARSEDIGVGIARAIRAAVSGRRALCTWTCSSQSPGPVDGSRAWPQVVDQVGGPAPRQLPAPDSIDRAVALLKSAKRPLILLGKGVPHTLAPMRISARWSRRPAIPYLPMSMAKGLLPDTHPQSASAARSCVLAEADVVMLVGARLNWLLSHGKGKTWGKPKQFIQIDISPTEMDSNVAIAAPVVG